MTDVDKPPVAPPAPPSSPPPYAKPPRGTNWTPILLGCGAVALLVLLLCGGLIWYAVSNVKSIAANAARDALVRMIRSTELSAEDKQELITEIDRVVEEYKAGEITLEQIGRIVEELEQSPLLGAAVIFFAETKYVQPSGLSDEEKAEARRTLQRVARGIHEGQLKMEQLEAPMQHIQRTGPDGQQELKEKLTDEELRQFLAELKQLADEAQVPDEPFEVDIGQAFKEAVDRALAKP